MRRDRICVNYPVGTTIEESPGGYLWTKIREDMWYDIDDRATRNDRMMDDLINGGRGQVIVVDKELATQDITACDLEEGDYVLTRWNWQDDLDAPSFDPNGSQWLWRVAGWTCNDDGRWSIAFDSSEKLLYMVGYAEDPTGGLGWDYAPIIIPLGPDTVFRYVDKDQTHVRWDHTWDWSFEYEFVSPPVVPA
jgi:hypothetical protein